MLAKALKDLLENPNCKYWSAEFTIKYGNLLKRLEYADQYMKEHNNG